MAGPPAPRQPGTLPGANPAVNLVLQGHRFIVVPMVISVVILSFRRSLGGVQVVGPGQWPLGNVFAGTLITSLVGWWGIPFGIFWSFVSLYQLWNGGRDVTYDVLCQHVRPDEARRILQTAPKPRPPAAIWGVRAIILVPVLLIGMFVLAVATA